MLILVGASETGGGEDQRRGVVAHEAGCPVVVVGAPVVQTGNLVTCAFHEELVDIDQRRLALLGIGVVGLQLQVFLVVLVGLVETILEAVHLGHIEIKLGLGGVVFGVDQTFVHSFGLGEVVHQTIAFAHLEIAAILLGLVRLDFVVRLFILLQSGDKLFLCEEIVGFLCQTFCLGKARSRDNHR